MTEQPKTITEEMLNENPEFVQKVKAAAETQKGAPMTLEQVKAWLEQNN